jgi:hypothetical protein
MTKTIYLMLALFIGSAVSANAQVRIGGTISPTASAVLDLNMDDTGALTTAAGINTQGLALPRVALKSANQSVADQPVAAPAKGLMIYNTATAGSEPDNVIPGIYYFDGTKWVFAGLSPKDKRHLDQYTSGETATYSIPQSVLSHSGKGYSVDTYTAVNATLKWTTENLREGSASIQTDLATTGYFASKFPGKQEGERGYYYTWYQAAGTTTPANYNASNDICHTSFGGNWRLPTKTEWEALRDNFSSLSVEQQALWKTGPSALSGIYASSDKWLSWGNMGFWWSSSVQYVTESFSCNSEGTWDNTTTGRISVRCVSTE